MPVNAATLRGWRRADPAYEHQAQQEAWELPADTRPHPMWSDGIATVQRAWFRMVSYLNMFSLRMPAGVEGHTPAQAGT